MEYELYSYCTGMGVFVIFLIVVYHFLGEDLHPVKNEQDNTETVANWDQNWYVWFIEYVKFFDVEKW